MYEYSGEAIFDKQVFRGVQTAGDPDVSIPVRCLYLYETTLWLIVSRATMRLPAKDTAAAVSEDGNDHTSD